MLSALRRVKRWLIAPAPFSPLPYTYRIGDVELAMTAGHTLRENQSNHKYYDLFAYSLGQGFDEGLIVDIGANVGDTAAALCSAGPRHVLCVEPQQEYFDLLKQNAAAIGAKTGSTIECVQALLGPETMHGSMVRSQGTAWLDATVAGEAGLPLDRLV